MKRAEKFDVVIVGGGPAGLAVASRLGPNLSSLLIHQDKRIGSPVRTSGGCWVRDMEALGIPSSLGQPVTRAGIYSDNEQFTLDLSSNPVAILDVEGTYQWLASQSKAEIRCSSKFLEARSDGDDFILKVRADGDTYEVRTRKVIDASGWRCAVLESLGLLQHASRRGIGIEYEYPAPTHDPNEAALFFGQAAPTGYGWAFPTNSGALRLGVGVIVPQTDLSPKDVMSALLDSDALERMNLPRPKDFHVNAGILPSCPYGGKLVFGSVIRVGDSANMATPTLGEGIRICVEQGRALGVAFSADSDRALLAWERAARKRFELQYKIGFMANQRAAAYGPADWDKSVARMKGLPPEELIEFFRNEFSAKVIAVRGSQAIGQRIARLFRG